MNDHSLIDSEKDDSDQPKDTEPGPKRKPWRVQGGITAWL